MISIPFVTTPCSIRFGAPDPADALLPIMIAVLHAGGYAPRTDVEEGTWPHAAADVAGAVGDDLLPTDDHAVLVHSDGTLPDIRFTSRIGSRPSADRAVEAALACLAKGSGIVPVGTAAQNARVDATMRILAATCSEPFLPGTARLVHAPCPWAPLRVETKTMRARHDVAPDGDGADLVPVCVHAAWTRRIDEATLRPRPGIDLEPFHVAVPHAWRPDPMEAMRTLSGERPGGKP